MTNPILPLALLLALGASACGADDDPGTTVDGSLSPDAATLDGGPSEPLINGEPASVYYGRFVFEQTSTHNEGAAAFPRVDGKNIYLVQFYLRADHTYVMFYSDGEGEVRGDGTYSMAVAPADQRRLTGTWRVDGSKLVLGTLLSCDGLSSNGQPALQCRIVTPPGSSGAPQGIALVERYGNPTEPDDQVRWGDFH